MSTHDREGSARKEIAALTAQVETGAKEVAKRLFGTMLQFQPINLLDGRDIQARAMKAKSLEGKFLDDPENNFNLTIQTNPPYNNLSIPGLYEAKISIKNGKLGDLTVDSVTWENRPEVDPKATSVIAAVRHERLVDKLDALRACKDHLLDPLQLALSLTPEEEKPAVISDTELDDPDPRMN